MSIGKTNKILLASVILIAGFLYCLNVQATSLTEQPNIRVGLYDAGNNSWIKIKVNGKYDIKNKNNKIIKTAKKNKVTRIKYKKKKNKYYIKRGKFWRETKSYVTIVPRRTNKIITILNYENRPAWNTELNDNQFRGNIELQYADATDKTWVVNELPLEKYLRGLAESGNDNDMAYLKSLITAARTYAAYHYLYPTKHEDEPYLLDTTGNDQVYRGYGFEKRAPNIRDAVKETKGKMVKYDGEIVVTPYFSQSDGRTRAWDEVWNGSKEYLVSKDDPGCSGLELKGHGVGMSAQGARYYAEQGWGWKKILKYYYTGVKIKKMY